MRCWLTNCDLLWNLCNHWYMFWKEMLIPMSQLTVVVFFLCSLIFLNNTLITQTNPKHMHMPTCEHTVYIIYWRKISFQHRNYSIVVFVKATYILSLICNENTMFILFYIKHFWTIIYCAINCYYITCTLHWLVILVGKTTPTSYITLKLYIT